MLDVFKQNNNVSFGYKSQIKKIATHCAYCGLKFSEKLPATVEHIKPRSKGGASNIKNYVAACPSCNGDKGDMNLDIFIEKKPQVQKFLRKFMNSFKGYIIGGIDYHYELSKTINRESRGKLAFSGNTKQSCRKLNFVV